MDLFGCEYGRKRVCIYLYHVLRACIFIYMPTKRDAHDVTNCIHLYRTPVTRLWKRHLDKMKKDCRYHELTRLNIQTKFQVP